MNFRRLLYVCVIILALLNPFNATAQSTESEARELLHKIDKAIGNINTVVYKINYANKFLARRDTIHTTAICSLYIAPRDKMKAFNIVDLEFTELKRITYGHRRYDGKRAFWTNYPIDSINAGVEPTIESKRSIRQAIVANYNNILLREYLFSDKPFGRYESAAGMIAITEETLNDTPVYVLKLTFEDTEEVRDKVEKHYVRRSDFMPVAFYNFLRMENMEQYNYYEVDYIAINPDISLDEFKIEKNEVINARERYQMLKEKAGM